MKILVTGAGGFIGSHLVETLIDAGHDVRAFVRYNSQGSWGWLEESRHRDSAHLEVIAGDIRDAAQVGRAVGGCAAVMHLAALIGIPYSYESPDSYVETNIRGTLNVLEAARDHGARVIQTSTSEVYGTAQFVPITEDHPLQAQSPYAATKISADQLALSFHRSFSQPVTILRPFNTYGPRQSARAVIPTVILQIASGIRKIRLGSVHPTRDFTFVTDTARAFLLAATSEPAKGQVINVGGNFDISIGETAKLIAEVMNVSIEIDTDDARVRPAESEVERLRADNRRAEALLGWRPQYGGRDGLRRGLAETVAWFRSANVMERYKVNRYNI